MIHIKEIIEKQSNLKILKLNISINDLGDN